MEQNFFQKSTIRKVSNSGRFQKFSNKLMQENGSTKKLVTQLFFSQNWFVNLSEYIWTFSDFFLIFYSKFIIQKIFVCSA